MNERRPLTRRCLLPLVVALAGSACGSNTTGTEDASAGTGNLPDPRVQHRSICDGSAGLRLAVAIPWSGALLAGQGVAMELGVDYLLVDGHCEYWVWQGAVWAPARRGVLTPGEAEELARDLDYDSWPKRDGQEYGPDLGRAWGTVVFFDGENNTWCNRPCEETGADLESWTTLAVRWGERLYARGADAEGPMRLRVFEAEKVGPEPTWSTWPLAQRPEALVDPTFSDQDIWGPAHRVTDPSELAALRALRPVLAAGNPGMQAGAAYVKGSAEERLFYFVFRDVTPFENAEGEVPGLFRH